MIDIRLLFAKALKVLLNPPALRQCEISKKAKVCSRSELTNVRLDDFSYIGNQCFMVDVSIGKYCSIADRCCIGGVAHPIERVSTSPVFQKGRNVLNTNFAFFDRPKDEVTIIENDVWIGMGAYIKGGITIHNGAVVGMGSVVTLDIPPYEICAGNPARFIKKRFDDDIIQMLMSSAWWNWPDEKICQYGDSFINPHSFSKLIYDYKGIK